MKIQKLLLLFSLILTTQGMSLGQKSYSEQTTSTQETKDDELSKDLMNYLNNNQYSQAEVLFTKLVNEKEYHNSLSYSEWLYCSLIFKQEKLFLEHITKNQYRYTQSESEQKEEEIRYQLSIKILKRYYKNHFKEIYEYIKNTNIDNQEELNMLVLFFGATNPNNKSRHKSEQREIINKYRQEHKNSKYDSYLQWLKKEINNNNHHRYSELQYNEMISKKFNQMRYLIIGVNRVTPESDLFKTGNGITISGGYSNKEFYIDCTIGLSFHDPLNTGAIITDKGENINLERDPSFRFTNNSMGVGGILSIGSSQVILLGRIGYSSIVTENSGKKYNLASNISLSPALKLNLCLDNRRIVDEYDRPFKIYLSSEIGYNFNIVSFHKGNNSNGRYIQVGLCFSF